jgi:hypothetical protein
LTEDQIKAELKTFVGSLRLLTDKLDDIKNFQAFLGINSIEDLEELNEIII